MYEVLVDSITGRRGKVAKKGDKVQGDMFTAEVLKDLIKNGALKSIDEPKKEVKSKSNG